MLMRTKITGKDYHMQILTAENVTNNAQKGEIL